MKYKCTCILTRCAGFAAAVSVIFTMAGCSGRTRSAEAPLPSEQTEEQPQALMWDSCTPVPGTPGLYELHPDFMEASNYTECLEFGGNLLLVAYDYEFFAPDTEYPDETPLPGDPDYQEEDPPDDFSPEEETQWEEGDWDDSIFEETNPVYRFALYSPWENTVLAAFNTETLSNAGYQVVGDQLLVMDYNSEILYCYDSHLALCGRCDAADLMESYGFIFYPAGASNCFWSYNYPESQLVRITLSMDSYTEEFIPLDVYALTLSAVTPDCSRLFLCGVDKDTLNSKLFLLDPSTMEETPFADGMTYFYGTLTDDHYLMETDPFYGIWRCGNFEGNASYFLLPSGTYARFLYDNTFVVFEDHYEEDLHYISNTVYNGSGIAMNHFRYDCGSPLREDSFYPSAAPIYLEDHNCCFQLLYSTDSNACFLVWDLAESSGSASNMTLYATEELAQKAALQLADPEEIPFPEEPATLIEDPESYDWGDLTDVHQTANLLAEQYGITLYIGPEVPNTINVYDVQQCLDAAQLDEALESLSSILSCYPEGFFSQLVYSDMDGIRLYITSDITSEEEGLVSYATGFVTTINNYVVMVLNVNDLYNWDYTVNHEISHMIDRRLEFLSSVYPDALFSEDTWCSQNPEGCEYLYTYEDYWDNAAYITYSEYFIDEYGMTFPTEDRAELFGAAMSGYVDSDSYAYYSYSFEAGSPLTGKLQYYCDAIRDGFNTEGWPEELPWEAVLSR